MKYGITKSLTLDATTTRISPVEADQTQINLRFSLFFPEKREFFLEGQGLFSFGGVTTADAAGAEPVRFFSRQIGLYQGRSVPIVGGGRLTGRVDRYSIGALSITAEQG